MIAINVHYLLIYNEYETVIQNHALICDFLLKYILMHTC